ncbi:hypothetical protein C1645_708671 [Glomus cerebriforme]|uniref:Nitrogen regulatory protein areA GATA-like domain-containing protein n=1 Tax=Glomus cerebriforme TaxID=658196 RepID=A0A397TF69_9GLOM|nr:hypothetical protein C1645_708671 [Glomus cerebriforme]
MQPNIMMPDDNLSGIIAGIQHAPKICVDYLSHEWTQEDDIWTSWKVMSKQKKELANGIRLENASWRTWAKQKYNLKTVDPKKLNWLKDSDVTWLYGPLHTAWSSDIKTLPKSQNTEDKLNLMPSSSSTKSCLKKKSISEILRPIVKGRYGPLVSSNSDTQLYKREKEKDRENDWYSSDCETPSTCSSMSIPTTPTTGPTKSILFPIENNVSHNRKIQFNDRVEQCIAVESDDDIVDVHDSDSSDDGIVMKPSLKKKKRDLSTICKLAPTKLKEDRIHQNEYSSLYSSSRRRANPPPPKTTDKPWTVDDEDDLELDLIDFDPTISSKPTYQIGTIIPPPGDVENKDDDDDENKDDDIIGKAVNGVREIVHWCSDMVRLF